MGVLQHIPPSACVHTIVSTCRVGSSDISRKFAHVEQRTIDPPFDYLDISEEYMFYFFIFFHKHLSTFQLLDKPWSQVSPLLLPGSCLQFLSRIGFGNPTARRFFIECC